MDNVYVAISNGIINGNFVWCVSPGQNTAFVFFQGKAILVQDVVLYYGQVPVTVHVYYVVSYERFSENIVGEVFLLNFYAFVFRERKTILCICVNGAAFHVCTVFLVSRSTFSTQGTV